MKAEDVFLSKIVLAGDSAVGKTSICHRYLGRGFTVNHDITLGAEYFCHDQPVHLQEQELGIRFQIWDISGQERFTGIRNLYYPGTRGLVIVYDVTRPGTFHGVANWIAELVDNLGTGFPPVVIAGNKIDLREKNSMTVQKAEGEKLAREIRQALGASVAFVETSALTGENVQLLFQYLARLVTVQTNRLLAPDGVSARSTSNQ